MLLGDPACTTYYYSINYLVVVIVVLCCLIEQTKSCIIIIIGKNSKNKIHRINLLINIDRLLFNFHRVSLGRFTLGKTTTTTTITTKICIYLILAFINRKITFTTEKKNK